MEAPLRCTDTEGGRRKENQPSGTSSLHFSTFFPLIFVLFFFHDEATAVVLSPSSAFISGGLSSLDILHSVPPASAPRITPFYKLPQHLNCFDAIRKNLNAKKEQQNKLFALVDSGPALPPPNQPISPVRSSLISLQSLHLFFSFFSLCFSFLFGFNFFLFCFLCFQDSESFCFVSHALNRKEM